MAVTLLDFKKYAKKRLGEKEYREIEKQAELEVKIYKSLQAQVSHEIKKYMETKDKEPVDLADEFGLSPGKVSKMVKGTGNFDFATIAHVFAQMGKNVSLTVR